MGTKALTTRGVAPALLALAALLTVWLVLFVPAARAATVKLDGARTTLTTDPGTTTALF